MREAINSSYFGEIEGIEATIQNRRRKNQEQRERAKTNIDYNPDDEEIEDITNL